MGWYSSISRWNIVFIKRHRDIAGLVIRIHVHRQDVISQCIWKRDLSLRYCTCMRHEIALVITAYWGGLCAFWPVHTGKRDTGVHVHVLPPCTNCTKPQLDIHGVPTLTISSIVGTANMCSGSPPFIDFRTSRQKSSGDRFLYAFRFFPFLLFFFFFIIRAPLEIGLLGYKGNNQRRVEKYEIFFWRCYLRFPSFFFLCFFFEKNLKS